MNKLLSNALSMIRTFINRELQRDLEANLFLTAGIHISRMKQQLGLIESLSEVEFKVFSQWGEDGIIQYLINQIPIENRTFIEFGVEDYREANTRFLLMNNNWKGLIFDGSKKNIERIKMDNIYWKYELTAASHFITRENINDIIEMSGFKGDIGLLSIDIDGNDYWVWEAIDVVQPIIVICEYNNVFGNTKAVTVPYDPNFVRTKAHYSNLYYGASLPALCYLAEKKGYDFVGSNSAGSNAFFVRKDLSNKFKKLTAKEGYIEGHIRESRNKDGSLSYIGGRSRIELIRHLPVVDVTTEKEILITDII